MFADFLVALDHFQLDEKIPGHALLARHASAPPNDTQKPDSERTARSAGRAAQAGAADGGLAALRKHSPKQVVCIY